MVEHTAGITFLQRKFKLGNAPEVRKSSERQAQHGGPEIPEQDYAGRIQAYLDRLSRIISHPKKGERNLKMLKHFLYDKIIIKPEEVPDGYWQSIIQMHEEEGRPIDFIPQDIKKDLVQSLIKDQRESLDIWINHLNSPDTNYPDWFKYYVIRSVLVMGRYDKGKKKFMERSKTGKSVSQFPELNQEALSFVADALQRKQNGTLYDLNFRYGIRSEEREDFRELLTVGDPNFARLYAWAIDKITPISEEQLQQTEGQWVRYTQGSDPQKLVSALSQYGTGWCIRGEGIARQYLERSDLEIYFSLDQDGKPTIPRIVIVTRNGNIDEVRGVAEQEHWDQYITDVVEQKLSELPDGQKFKKRIANMQQMTAIHHKSFSVDKKTGVRTYLNPTLTREELRFLYELDSEIEGFGYQIPDPRIKEILAKRDVEKDMLVIFDCEKSQIARNAREINQGTKVYIGPLETGIFNLLSQYKIKEIYTSFHEGKIRLNNILIGGKSAQKLGEEIEEIGELDYFAQGLLNGNDFTTLKHPTSLEIVRLKVSSLGLSEDSNLDQIYERAQELGLDLCPAEVGPHLRLQDQSQPIGNTYYIGMEPISTDEGDPQIFEVSRYDDDDSEMMLSSTWSNAHYKQYYPDDEFVFRLPESSQHNKKKDPWYSALTNLISR